MATSHSSTPLNTLSVAQPISVTPLIGSPRSGPPLHHVSHAAVGVVTNGNSSVNQNTSSNNASSNSPPATSGLSNAATPPNSYGLSLPKKYCSYISNVLLTIFALAAAWVTFKLATWTAAKDWKEYCNEQTERSFRLTQACTKAVNSELSAPPWIADWLHPSNSTIYKRYNTSLSDDHSALHARLPATIFQATVYSFSILLPIFCYSGIWLYERSFGKMKTWTSAVILQASDGSSCKKPSWTAVYDPREAPSHGIYQSSPSFGYIRLRRRFIPKSTGGKDDVHEGGIIWQSANATYIDDLENHAMDDIVHDDRCTRQYTV